MATQKCIFCEIYANQKGIIYEDEYFYARFDAFPVSPGHAEIIPKRHVVSLQDLTEKEWANLRIAIKDVVRIIESTDLKKLYTSFINNPLNDKSKEYCQKMRSHIGIGKKPDGYNFGNNDGEAAGRTVHHFHYHIIPRYFGDVAHPEGGIRNIIPELGNYKK